MAKKYRNAKVLAESTKTITVEVTHEKGAISTLFIRKEEGEPIFGGIQERHLRRTVENAWANYAVALWLKRKAAYTVEVTRHRAAPENVGIGGGRYLQEDSDIIKNLLLELPGADKERADRVYCDRRGNLIKLEKGLTFVSNLTGWVLWEPKSTQVSGLLWESKAAFEAAKDADGNVTSAGAYMTKHHADKKREAWYEEPFAYEALGLPDPDPAHM